MTVTRRPRPADRLQTGRPAAAGRRLLGALPMRGRHLDARQLDDDDLDDLERAAAGILRAVGDEQGRRAGITRRPAPPTLTPWGNVTPQWRPDHPYALDTPNGRQYVAEPYQLTADDLRELLAIADAGWKITVSGQARHFPGRTVAVYFTRRPTHHAKQRSQEYY